MIDRYGPLPEPAQLLVSVARLRLLCRHYGITELAVTGAGAGATLRVAPLSLADSAQVRLSRMYPGARYRATAATVQVPVPRSADSVGAPRIRDLELLQMVADLLLALDGRPKGDVDITTVNPNGPGGQERSDRGIEPGGQERSDRGIERG